MNLMEVDSQVFQNITSYLQTLWSGPFQIIGSLILLWRQVLSIHVSSEELEGIKLIKLQAWEHAFLERISGIRCSELSILRKYVHLLIY